MRWLFQSPESVASGVQALAAEQAVCFETINSTHIPVERPSANGIATDHALQQIFEEKSIYKQCRRSSRVGN
jgi:hypothetical protein